MSAHDLALLQKWVELNQDVLIKYWDGEIGTPKAPSLN